MMIPFRRIRMDFMLAVGRSLGAAITISPDSAAASHRPTFSFRAAHHRRATAGRPYSEPGTLRMRRRPAIDLPRIARDVEDAVPYEVPFNFGCRTGTCAPPFHCLFTAAHRWPPYGECGANSPESVRIIGAFCAGRRGRRPLRRKPASQSLRSKSIQSVFPATCASEKLPRASSERACSTPQPR